MGVCGVWNKIKVKNIKNKNKKRAVYKHFFYGTLKVDERTVENEPFKDHL